MALPKTTVWHTHHNPKWSPRSQTEALTILVEGWQCNAKSTSCPFVGDQQSEPRATPRVARVADNRPTKRKRTRRATRRNGLARRTSPSTVRLEKKR